MAFAQQVQSLSALWTLMYFSAIYKATSKGIFLWVSTISCKGEWQNCLSIQFWSRVCVYRLNFRQKKQNRRQISIIWAREGGTRWSLQTWSYIWSFSERKLSIWSTGFHRQQKCLFSNTKKYVYMIPHHFHEGIRENLEMLVYIRVFRLTRELEHCGSSRGSIQNWPPGNQLGKCKSLGSGNCEL